MRIYELRQKEVINLNDGCRYGFICDLEIDCECGDVKKIIIAAPGKILGVFGREQEYRINWDCIKQIGDDIILVDVETGKILHNCD